MTPPRGSDGRPEFTRENVLAVAAELFHARGYRATSLQEVADVFGVQRPAIYYHFKNKAELLVEIHARLLEELMAQLDEIAAADLAPAEKIRRLIGGQVRLYADNISGLAMLLQNQEELPPEVRGPVQADIRRYGALLEDMIDEVVGDDRTLDPRMTVMALSGMTGWMYRWYRPAGAWDPDDIAHVFTRLAEEGLLARP
jgi:AcrR family transcriptional regulator